jgi:hypothetical protein
MLVDEFGVVAYNGSCSSIPHALNLTYTFAGYNSNQTIKIDVPLRNYARGATLDGTGEGGHGDRGICLLNLEIGGCTFGAPFYSGALLAVDDERGVLALAQGGVSQEAGLNSTSLKIFEKGETFDYV